MWKVLQQYIVLVAGNPDTGGAMRHAYRSEIKHSAGQLFCRKVELKHTRIHASAFLCSYPQYPSHLPSPVMYIPV